MLFVNNISNNLVNVMFISIFYTILLFFPAIICRESGSNKQKEISRHQLKSFGSNKTATPTEDPHSVLIDTLIKDADQLFGKSRDSTEKPTMRPVYQPKKDKKIDLRSLKQTLVFHNQIKDDVKPLKDVEVSLFAVRPTNTSNKTVKALKTDAKFSPKPLFPMTGPPNTLIVYHKNFSNKSGAKDDNDNTNLSKPMNTTSRTCIFCNSLENPDCNDPRRARKSLAIVCQDKDDKCYSQTTPFGVVDRGCFNARKNLTTYVCACNFCNHIPITELPYMFQSKSYWVKNVIELSRSQYLSRIVFKDMSCLRCEINGTSKSLVNNENILAELNCLSPTNIELMETEHCEEDQICAVVSKPSDHFIWRGCIRTPLYNYWLQTCDKNLCNHDPIVSVFD